MIGQIRILMSAAERYGGGGDDDCQYVGGRSHDGEL